MGSLSHETNDREITQLARQLSRVLERAAPEERAELREFAKDLVSESTERTVTPVDPPALEHQPLGFLGALLPLLVAGFFLLFVLPPVGIVFLLLGIGIALWGTVPRFVTHGDDEAAGNGSVDLSRTRGEAAEHRA